MVFSPYGPTNIPDGRDIETRSIGNSNTKKKCTMELEPLFLAALQSSFLLGLIHGVNPCGHSWLVLAPFVTGEKHGSRVVTLTGAFLIGTALACLALGATLGTVSMMLPAGTDYWVEVSTSILLMLVGIVLLYDPHILHSHDHDHDHAHGEDHDHGHHHHHDRHDHHPPDCGCTKNHTPLSPSRKWLALSLFGIGFVNMIIPCPTAAVMYGYALNSGSTLTATLVFGSYAISTAIAVGLVIYLIYRITTMASQLQKSWVEPLIMRTAGVVIVLFSAYTLYGTVAA